MAVQYGALIRDARMDAIESVCGASPVLTIRSGAMPANCAAANVGVALATLNLPADWMAASSGGVKAKLGTWQDAAADATGTATHFRIHNTAGTVCHVQGTVGLSGADMILDSVNFTAGQSFTVASWTLTEGNP